MSCPIHVGDTFVWQKSYKVVEAGDTVTVDDIYVDEDGEPQVAVTNYRGEGELVDADSIHQRVSDGLLERQ